MGIPVDFVGSNLELQPPAGRDDVQPLPTFTNGNVSVSCWEFTESELAEIVRTGKVYVSCFSGKTQPPIFVGSRQVVKDLVSHYGGTFRSD